jgi:hypothetical protein
VRLDELVNSKLLKAPFCGIRISINLPKWKTRVIFHPTIFGTALWANCAPLPIDKSLKKVSPFSKRRKFCNKNK